MRLGQLARKLAMRPSEIVTFLADQHIEIDGGANTRLEEEHLALILKAFGSEPQPTNGDEPAEAVETPGVPASQPEERVDDPATNPPDTAAEEPETSPELVASESPEVIKAQKIELSGLKVLGKIDLPEPRKAGDRQAPAEESLDQMSVKPTPPGERRPGDRNKRRDQQRPRKNPIVAQREREREQRLRIQEEKAAAEKERKTQNYHKRVKMSPPTKAVRLVDEPLMQMSEEDLAERPKTWIGRLFHWLTNA